MLNMGRTTASATLGWACVALALTRGRAQNLPVPPLPYSYSALVPFISEHALRVSVYSDGRVVQIETIPH